MIDRGTVPQPASPSLCAFPVTTLSQLHCAGDSASLCPLPSSAGLLPVHLEFEAPVHSSCQTDEILSQVPSTVASSDGPGGPSVVGIPPSRARRQLAARLAMRKRAEDAAGEQQGGQRHVIQMTLREPARFRDRRGSDDENNDYEHGDAGGSSSSSSEEDDASEYTRAALRSRVYEDDDDEKQAGRDFSLDHDEIDSDAIGVGGRSAGVQGSESRRRYKAHRPSTMEVVGQRRLLDDEDDEEDSRGGEGPFADGYDVEESEESSSDEDDLVEIRTRRVG